MMMMVILSCSFVTLYKSWWTLWTRPLLTTYAVSNPMTSSWPSREFQRCFIICCFCRKIYLFFKFTVYILDTSNTACLCSVLLYKTVYTWFTLAVVIRYRQVWSQTCGAAAQSLRRPGNHPDLCCRLPIEVLMHPSNTVTGSHCKRLII